MGRRPARLADVLQVFARLEPDGPTRRDTHFLAGPRVTADSTLARLDLEDAKAPKLDAIAALHRQPHGVEDSVDRHLSLDLGDVGDFRDFVDDVDLNHEPSQRMTVTTIKIVT